MSDLTAQLIYCGMLGILGCEVVVRLIGKFKYGIWAALLPPITWFKIIRDHFFLLVIVFLSIVAGTFFSGIIH